MGNSNRTKLIAGIAAAVTACALACDAGAVIVYGPQGRNTSAPTGAYADSGWQYLGRMNNGFSGWPIGPRHFLTAAHVGGGVGTTLTMPNGSVYTATSRVSGGGDLAVFEVSGTFPAWTPLWDAAIDGSEIGKPAILYGRGLTRGTEVYSPLTLDVAANPSNFPSAPPVAALPRTTPTRVGGGPVPQTGGTFRGWEWLLVSDWIPSWGTNTVDGVTNISPWGDLLYYTFKTDDPNSAALAGGDSGGATFIRSPSGAWKLAGIHLAVDGPFSHTPTGPLTHMSLADTRGLWYDNGAGGRDQVPFDDAAPVPTASYSTRIASFRSNLTGYLGPTVTLVPEPTTLLATVATACGLLVRRRARRVSAGRSTAAVHRDALAAGACGRR